MNRDQFLFPYIDKQRTNRWEFEPTEATRRKRLSTPTLRTIDMGVFSVDIDNFIPNNGEDMPENSFPWYGGGGW